MNRSIQLIAVYQHQYLPSLPYLSSFFYFCLLFITGYKPAVTPLPGIDKQTQVQLHFY